jgi:hypothetical protein
MGSYTVSMEMLAVWPILTAILIFLDRRHGRMPLFIVYSYIAGFAINHWFGALVHVVPTDASQFAVNTPEGFALSTWGFVFLVAGAAIYPARRYSNKKQLPQDPDSLRLQADTARRAVNILLLMGVACWVIELTPIDAVPSAGAIISGGKQLLIAAICLKCWLAWTHSNRGMLLLWLMAGFAFPFYTMLFLGFLSFGISYLLSILIFVGTFYRPRWQVLVFGAVSVYVGLSVYLGYAENRGEIRDAVWGGQSMQARLEAAEKMMADVAPFDPANPSHRRMIDLRLNQNWLVGVSMNFVPEYRPYADGETIYMALLAVVPRAIWSDKPITAGSGNLVSEFTGITFAEGTSVGIGQVMEFYVNFGWTGVAVGFFIFGFGLRYIDLRVGRSIRDQDWSNAGLWFAVGLSAMQPTGQLVEITASTAAAAIFGVVARRFSRGPVRHRRAVVSVGQLHPRSALPLTEPPGARGRGLVNRPEHS